MDMPNSAPASFPSSVEDGMTTTTTKVKSLPGEDLFSPVIQVDPMLGKYFEPEKVSIQFVRNCGILLEEVEPEDGNRRQKSLCRKDSMFMQYKIPVEIRKNSRSHSSKEGWRKFGGIIFGVSSSLCFSLTLLLAKVLREQHDFHPICVTMWRYVGILAPAVPISMYFHCFTAEPVFDAVWPLNNVKNVRHVLVYAMQGICGCSAIIFRFYSLEFITLADATVVSFSSPVLVAVLAHIFLGEKCGVISILVAVLTAVGVLVIARPPLLTSAIMITSEDAKVWIGVVLALASMACHSGLLILIRNIRQTHFSLMLLVGGGWGVGQSGILGLSLNLLKVPETTWVAFLIGFLCVLTFLGQICIILALKYENAGPVAVIRSSEVIFAYLWQLQFFGIYPDIFSMVGASIIIFSVVVIATKSWVAGLNSDNVHRKRLLILTK